MYFNAVETMRDWVAESFAAAPAAVEGVLGAADAHPAMQMMAIVATKRESDTLR
jgi:hypothetical protein